MPFCLIQRKKKGQQSSIPKGLNTHLANSQYHELSETDITKSAARPNCKLQKEPTRIQVKSMETLAFNFTILLWSLNNAIGKKKPILI